MKCISSVGLICLLSFVCFSTFSVSAQPTPIVGKQDSIFSKLLQENRNIQVVLPANYKPGSDQKYDVLYVLDGEWYTKLVKDIQHFVASQNFMPPVIIVGVHNAYTYRKEHDINFNTRDRDFQPTHQPGLPISGEAAKFLSFLKEELIPYVNSKYPANNSNILYGHSYGGMFVLYALLSEPKLFESYIAADPTFYWDQYLLHKLAAEKLKDLPAMNRTLFVSGLEASYKVMLGLDLMDSIYAANAPSTLTRKVNLYPKDENHVSVQLKTIYDGLKFLYEGYNTKLEIHPSNGIVSQNKPLSILCIDPKPTMYYTLDGTEPTKSAKKVEDVIKIQGPAEFHVKSITPSGKFDLASRIQYKSLEQFGLKLKKSKKPSDSIGYSLYNYDGSSWPNFKKLKPSKQGVIKQGFDINQHLGAAYKAGVIEGPIKLTEAGYGIFYVKAPGAYKLYVGDQLLLHYDGKQGAVKQSYVVPLEVGAYSFRIELLHQIKDSRLELAIFLPKDGKEEWWQNVFFSL